jgi:prephenate dehydrogenase
MADPDFLRDTNIAVFGLGLMGGSFALAVQPYCRGVFGIDPDPEALADAKMSGIFSAVSSEPSQLVTHVDLVVLAAPVKVIIDLIMRLPDWLSGKAMVLDLGSTKESIVMAMELMPERFDALGGHPMCGKETSSFKNAEATLFKGHPFILTPLKRTSPNMLRLTEQLIDRIGAYPLYLDPTTHDYWVSATSHVPHLLANCLAAITPVEAAPLIGPGFRSSARLAASSSRVLLDILQTNRSNILEQITTFDQRLQVIKNMLERQEYLELEEVLKKGSKQYYDLVRK